MMQDQTDQSTFTASHPALVPDLLLQRFRLRARRRVAWLRQVWQLTTPENEGLGAYHQEVDRILQEADIPEAEQRWYEEAEGLKEINEAIREVEAVLSADRASRFFLLGQIFGLDDRESDLLQACLALALDPQLDRVCAYLQDQANRPWLTDGLVARLYGHGSCLPLSPESPLKIWRLVEATEIRLGEPFSYTVDPHIRDWLTGRNELDEKLLGLSYLQAPEAPLPGWPLQKAVQMFTERIGTAPPGRMRMEVVGAAGSGRRTFAACVARQLDMPLLVVEADRVAAPYWETFCIHAFRQAYLDRCALAWVGESLTERFWPSYLAPFQVQFVIGEPGRDIRRMAGVDDRRITLPPLSLDATRSLWMQLLPQSAGWEAEELERLLQKYHLTAGQIAGLAGQGVRSLKQAEVHLKAQSRNHLGTLAQPLAATFTWDDLVVSPMLRRQLRDFVYEATERRAIWERPELIRLFPQGRGLFALFTGAPGTGKTMAAQVIAARLDLPLFRIDLSSVVSKYVGETSKNLERILSQARQMNAVLLFDEADALFGKRTEIKDAHDRFANTDTNYLLQAIEQFPGIAILTSNRKANIDNGFIRRLRYVVDFPKPDAGQRTEIWRRLLREITGASGFDRLQGSLGLLSENLELTGAQIKLAVLSALITARREGVELTLEHLLQGVEREWMKEGRGISRELRKVLQVPSNASNGSTGS